MEFLSTVSLHLTSGEMLVWSALKEALRPDEGFAFLRYPIFPTGEDSSYRYEPDILLLHRQLGLLVIEVKDCRADQVEALVGQTWQMRNWRSPTEAPYEQAQRQMWALMKHFKPYVSGKLRSTSLVALPFASSEDWRANGFDGLPCNPGILHQDQLTPARLRKRLYELTRGDTQPLLDDEDWCAAQQVLGLRPVLEGMQRRESPRDWSDTIAMIRESELTIPQLDLEQLRIGMEIPPGPQRIRGIAGSGKTLLLAMKAARMHLSHPDWDIAFTFHTKSLYQVVRQHITRFCRFFGDRDPDWSKLSVLHGWGSKAENGLYRELAVRAGIPPRSLDWAKERLPKGSSGERLAVCCDDLLASGRIRPSFDAILIDEGQDFMPAFYQMARAALRPPTRLIWAYDEAQSLDNLHVPDAETLFGRDEKGRLVVDLSGQYPGGIWKSRVMRKCYRTPSRILMPAHAFGMGLLRPQGPVQLITTQAGWSDIGYKIESGSFDAAGREIVLTRPSENSPHPLDGNLDVDWIRARPAESRLEEFDACAQGISYLCGLGVAPDDILVVLLGASYSGDANVLAHKLEQSQIATHLADNQHASTFRSPGSVTISGVNRAKGQEAPFVFVLRLDQLANREGEVAERNQLFVSLTRSRALCQLSGVVPQAAALFAELQRVQEAKNRVTFQSTDPTRLRRRLSQEPEVAPVLPFVRHLPLYDIPVAAGSWRAERTPDLDDVEWIDASALGALNEHMFALRVKGDSMEPRIPDGTIAVFQRTEGRPPEGSVVLASLSTDAVNGASLVVKRLMRQPGEAEIFALHSENPRYPAILVASNTEEGIRIEGILKALL